MGEELADFQHPRFARNYLRFSQLAERRGGAEFRRRLVAGLTGRVIEVGAGNGLNFAHYPTAITALTAVEPDDTLRTHAERAAEEAPVPVTVVAGHADALPAADASQDAAVVSLVLCSVPDPATALAELTRVLRPGGHLRFFEHVRSGTRAYGLLQDLVTPLWRRAAGGCRLNRTTTDAITAAGFVVDELERFTYRPPSAPPLTHIIGRAHRP